MSKIPMIYFDNASTTPLLPEVISEMVEGLTHQYGNSSSLHQKGRAAKAEIENTRKQIASFLKVDPMDLVFTSGASESNNLILTSVVKAKKIKKVFSSPLEHKSVLDPLLDLEKNNKDLELVWLKANKDGSLDLAPLSDHEPNSEVLVSLMHGNNEIGNFLDLEKVSEICQQKGFFFHSDLTQSLGHSPLDLSQTPLDFFSFSAHKLHGPKAVGVAYLKNAFQYPPQILGGSQESGLRAGTPSGVNIRAMGKALALSFENSQENSQKRSKLKNYAIEKLQENFEDIEFNGLSQNREKSLDTILNVSLKGEFPMLAFQLDLEGICVSQGSACSSGSVKRSKAIEILDDLHGRTEQTHTPLRISFSHLNTLEEIDRFIDSLLKIVKS